MQPMKALVRTGCGTNRGRKLSRADVRIRFDGLVGETATIFRLYSMPIDSGSYKLNCFSAGISFNQTSLFKVGLGDTVTVNCTGTENAAPVKGFTFGAKQIAQCKSSGLQPIRSPRARSVLDAQGAYELSLQSGCTDLFPAEVDT